MASTRTSIANIQLDAYAINASGPYCTSIDELEIIAHSGSAAVMMKSCTIEQRLGNEEPRFAQLPYGAIQCMGLPNLGYNAYMQFAYLLQELGKPIIASVAGFSPGEYETMVDAFNTVPVDLIEVNLSCPNIEGKPQAAYDFEQAEHILKLISHSKTPLGLKLPAYYDQSHHEQMARLILKYGISFISCINSIGNSLAIDTETESSVIKPKKGFGGLCGRYIKPIALGNVRTFYGLLNGQVSIFGVGGISSGKDAFEFLLAGADAVQSAAVFEKQGISCFSRINSELNQILDSKGYSSVQEAKGMLRYA